MKLDFDKMCFVKKVYWKIKLWLMDHRISFVENHWSILETSYYYTHTEDDREVFKNLKEILKRSDVVELRALMHLMIEKITLDPETRSLDKIHIKINPALTDYLGVSIEEEASKKASSFSYVNRKVLKFII